MKIQFSLTLSFFFKFYLNCFTIAIFSEQLNFLEYENLKYWRRNIELRSNEDLVHFFQMHPSYNKYQLTNKHDCSGVFQFFRSNKSEFSFHYQFLTNLQNESCKILQFRLLASKYIKHLSFWSAFRNFWKYQNMFHLIHNSSNCHDMIAIFG